MRKLNKKQKKILEDWLKKQENLTIHFSVENDLPYEVFEKIKEINDFETINQEIESYVVGLIIDKF